MNKMIQIISAALVVLSIVFFLYGSIKLAKAVEPNQIVDYSIDLAKPPESSKIIDPSIDSAKTSELTKTIDTSVDKILVEDTSRLITQQKAEVIIGVSVVTLILGGVGFTLSSRKGVS